MHELLVQHAVPGPATSSRMHARRRALRVRASASALHEHLHARGHHACMRTSVACSHAECARGHASASACGCAWHPRATRVRTCGSARARALLHALRRTHDCTPDDARTRDAHAAPDRPPDRPPAPGKPLPDRPCCAAAAQSSRVGPCTLALRFFPSLSPPSSLFSSSLLGALRGAPCRGSEDFPGTSRAPPGKSAIFYNRATFLGKKNCEETRAGPKRYGQTGESGGPGSAQTRRTQAICQIESRHTVRRVSPCCLPSTAARLARCARSTDQRAVSSKCFDGIPHNFLVLTSFGVNQPLIFQPRDSSTRC